MSLRSWIRHARPTLLAALLAAVVAGCSVPVSPEEQELRDALGEALPDLERYELVEVDEAQVREALQSEMTTGSGDREPVHVQLPILRADGTVADKTWTAYHVNVRGLQGPYTPDGFQVQTEAFALPNDLPAVGSASSTFQGVPADLTVTEVLAMFEAQDPLDESQLQPSVLNLIGDGIEGAYYGDPENPAAHVIERLDSVLEPAFGPAEADRLASLVPENYLIYRHEDFQPPVEHGETTFEPITIGLAGEGDGHDHDAHAHGDGDGPRSELHAATRTLRPVMVADSTVYDPDTRSWLVSHWFDRVDAAANRQNAFLWLANLELDTDAPGTDFPDDNRVLVRTEVGGYLVLTEFGADQIDYPANSCSGSPNFINEVRGLSRDTLSHPNEYWMWWTTNYGGGCGYISTLGATPRDGAVAWSGYGSGTVDWTSFVFMHESGHIIGGTHQTNAPGSPETRDSHRCELFGFWEIGPTGPSLMSYASGQRTYCFAQTEVDFGVGDTIKNLTKVADYLHTNLD